MEVREKEARSRDGWKARRADQTRLRKDILASFSGGTLAGLPPSWFESMTGLCYLFISYPVKDDGPE
jgi:hypothetical protein